MSGLPLSRLLPLRVPLTQRGQAVHFGAVVEGRLALAAVFGLARPGPLRRGLQRAAMAEDFSWDTSAARYAEVYQGVLPS